MNKLITVTLKVHIPIKKFADMNLTKEYAFTESATLEEAINVIPIFTALPDSVYIDTLVLAGEGDHVVLIDTDGDLDLTEMSHRILLCDNDELHVGLAQC